MGKIQWRVLVEGGGTVHSVHRIRASVIVRGVQHHTEHRISKREMGLTGFNFYEYRLPLFLCNMEMELIRIRWSHAKTRAV